MDFPKSPITIDEKNLLRFKRKKGILCLNNSNSSLTPIDLSKSTQMKKKFFENQNSRKIKLFKKKIIQNKLNKIIEKYNNNDNLIIRRSSSNNNSNKRIEFINYSNLNLKNSLSNESIIINNEQNKINYEDIYYYVQIKLEENKNKIETFFHNNNKNFNDIIDFYNKFPDLITKIILNEINNQKDNLKSFSGNIERILNISLIKKLFFNDIISSIFYRNAFINFQNEEIIKNDIINIINKKLSDLIELGNKILKDKKSDNNVFFFPTIKFMDEYYKMLKVKRQFDKNLLKLSHNFRLKKNTSKMNIKKYIINNNNDTSKCISIEKKIIEDEEKSKKKELKRRKKEDELMKIFTESLRNIDNDNNYFSDENIKWNQKYLDLNEENKLLLYRINQKKKIKESLNIKSLSGDKIKNDNKKLFNGVKEMSKFEKEKSKLLKEICEYIKSLKLRGNINYEEIKLCEQFQNKIILLSNKVNNNFNCLREEFILLKNKSKNKKFVEDNINFRTINNQVNFFNYQFIFQRFLFLKNKKSNKMIITNSSI